MHVDCAWYLRRYSRRGADSSWTYSLRLADIFHRRLRCTNASLRRCCADEQLAVGASVPYAQAAVGAVASQFETNPSYGTRGLALMATGRSPEEVLKTLLAHDDNFGGDSIQARQVGLVSIDGRTAAYTGSQALQSIWAGERQGKGYCIQGNGLAGPQVLEAMEREFLKASEPLAERLLAALVAGDAAGGQRTGRESAALLVRTIAGFPMDVDLRVDHSSDPVGELLQIYNMQAAREQVAAASLAARNGRLEQAKLMLIPAVARAPQWPRIWIQAAKVAEQAEEPLLALQYVTVGFSSNPVWAQQEIGEGTFAELGSSSLFHRWVSAEQTHNAMAAYHELGVSPPSREKLIRIARMLLEGGSSEHALQLLSRLPSSAKESGEDLLVRATALEANGKIQDAIEGCERFLKMSPSDSRIRVRLKRLRVLTDLRSEE